MIYSFEVELKPWADVKSDLQDPDHMRTRLTDRWVWKVRVIVDLCPTISASGLCSSYMAAAIEASQMIEHQREICETVKREKRA